MSVIFELRGTTVFAWPMPQLCLEQLTRLREGAGREFVDVIFGDEHTDAGRLRRVDHSELVDALNQLVPLAKDLPAGFELIIPPIAGGKLPHIGRGTGGILIGDRYHVIRCEQSFWTIQPVEELAQGIVPLQRVEPAEIETQNSGTLRVAKRKRRSGTLSQLLEELGAFLARDGKEEVEVVWG